MKNPVSKIILDKIRPQVKSIVQNKSCELFDMTLRSEPGGKILRITIDNEKGTCIEDCSEISKLISAYLDADETLIPYESYMLEVSTPGLLRPLRTETEFKRFVGRKCKVVTKSKDESGRSNYTGVIRNAENGVVDLFVEKENKTFKLNIENISKANLEIEF
ncbi:ribosome maturation factor RimP [Seleniivibrio sp.]|uniref:ribosome maturation factor RimP n=1 Tax=Seleniivibrio sp. TaxID=2898801 RepID=UPI0025F76358|nr:ribosome maturation factor RimP [Seleniivibrio sp.]MCD8554176.1 ribosome maturation factor RimP [Seleniivibrio sp.]